MGESNHYEKPCNISKEMPVQFIQLISQEPDPPGAKGSCVVWGDVLQMIQLEVA